MSRKIHLPPPPDLAPLTSSQQDRLALCACCHTRPRRVDRVPLAVWFGKPSFRAPAVCICHVCLTIALLAIGVEPADFAEVVAAVRVPQGPPS